MVPKKRISLCALMAFAFSACAASAQQVELLDFYLPTCGPCLAMAPTVQRLITEGVKVRKVDGSRDVALAKQLRVDSYPTFVLVVDGREAGRIVGATSYDQLRSLVAQANPQAQTQLASTGRTFAPTSGGEERAFHVGSDLGPGSPAPAATPAMPVMPAADAASATLLSTAVRITIDDPAGRSYGTGTLIDARQGEALLVTCAHLFRDATGKPLDTTGRLTIELYTASVGQAPQVTQRLAGQLVSYDFDADVALVAIRPQGQVAVARVATSVGSIQAGQSVRSVGCDLGADPTVRMSQIVQLNRYEGPPNIEATGAPVQGRSGGGLFNTQGELIGICFAADEEANEGLYAGLVSIHAQLDRVGLSELYQQGAPASSGPPLSLAMSQQPPAVASVLPASPPPFESFASAPASRRAPVTRGSGAPQGGLTPVIRGQDPAVTPPSVDPFAQAASRPPLSNVEQATLEEVVLRGANAEVTLMIRPKQPGAKTEIITLDTASPEFVAALRRMQAPQ